jgi:uncharacterized delta-60 repeat protein
MHDRSCFVFPSNGSRYASATLCLLALVSGGCQAADLVAEPARELGGTDAPADAGWMPEPRTPLIDAGPARGSATAFAPFVRPTRSRVARGGEAKLVVGVERFGYSGAIRVGAEGLPSGLDADVAVLDATVAATTLTVRRSEEAPEGGPFHARLRFEPLGEPAAASHVALELVLPGDAGTLDGSFGADVGAGEVTWPIGAESDLVEAVATAGERTLVALTGRSQPGEGRGYVVALTGEGALDPRFGEGGFIAEPPGPLESSYEALLADADGGFLLGLFTRATADAPARFEIRRYDARGALDPRFGDRGAVDLGEGKRLALVPRPGGFFVVGATVDARRPDGALDPDFGSGGHADAPVAPMTYAVDEDGRLLLAACRDGAVTVARLAVDGSPDPAFGHGGLASLEVDPGASFDGCSMALAPDGTIAMAVATFTERYYEPRARLLRFDARGLPDPTFDVRVDADASSHHGVSWLAIEPSGALVVQGSRHFGELKVKAYLARYLASGERDPTFGFDELADEVPLEGARPALDEYGRLVCAGSWPQVLGDVKRASMRVVRYWL